MTFRYIVFTDLDGTLLDHSTYSFRPALPALRFLEKKGIPLVLCTSKTRAETEVYRKRLKNADPFVVENGGGIFIPRTCFSFDYFFDREEDGYRIISPGTPYSELREFFGRLRERFPGLLKGFGDITDSEVAALCGFSLEEAALARQREYDEPFVLEDDSAVEEIDNFVREAGFRMTRGGRFFHLSGANDKGNAVGILARLYKKARGSIRTIGLGDSMNDLPLLQAVDVPVLVQKTGGAYDPGIAVEGLIRAPGAGPEGWRRAVCALAGQDSAV